MGGSSCKIGERLSSRLDRSGQDQLIVAILHIQSIRPIPPAKPGMTPKEREQRMMALRLALTEAVDQIDTMLEGWGGRRLTEVTSLGTAMVEATPPCIQQLAKLPYILGIMENQTVETSSIN